MDISYKTSEGQFNYRVAALIISDSSLLIMKDENSPYYYLPGGRVKMNETAEQAIQRELLEELEILAEPKRLVWVVENFFKEDVSKEQFHELSFYYLIDITKTDLLRRGLTFTANEGGRHDFIFRWVPIKELKELYMYPIFLKDKITNIPNGTEHIVEFKGKA